ncbi:MAG TPA: hypothetical protein VM510_09120 [Caulifigura sp.]|jgi:hypothetical protein|nr:hypothetical protein [Caulifigura sp.]
MTDQHTDWLQEQPAAAAILAAYAEREALLPKRPARSAATSVAATEAVVTAGEAEPAAGQDNSADEAENADAWVPRIAAVEGLEAAQLSQLHGGLIARGYLKYELFGRQIGMRYRLTPEGRRAADSSTGQATTAEAAA